MSSCWQQSKKLLHSLELPNFLMTLLLLLLTLPILVLSTVETRYIDDQLGDLITGAQPIYSPVTSWTQGATCSGCGFHPDPKLAFNHTWHDTTHHTTDPVPTVSFSFAGISVEVFCILPNPTDPVLTSTYNLTFTLDGLPIDTVYTHTSDLSTDYYYNTSVLRLDGLSQKSHTLTMSAASTVVNSTLQFDYATYMIDVASPSSSPSSTASSTLSLSDTLSSSSNALSSLDAPPSSIASSSSSPIQSSGSHLSSAAIAGATVGGAIFLVLSVLSMFCGCRYRHRIRQRVFLSSLRSRDLQMENHWVVEPFRIMPVGYRPMQISETNIPASTWFSVNPARTGDPQGNRNRRADTPENYTKAVSSTAEGPGAVDYVQDSSNITSRPRQAATEISGQTISSPTSASDFSRRQNIEQLRREIEQMKQEQREFRARFMPPLYAEG